MRVQVDVRLRQFASRLSRAWAWLAAAAGLGALLAVVQLLPTAEYLLQSQRASAVEYEYALTYSFWPWRFLGLLAPGLFGSPASGDFWGYGNYWEDAVYVGLLPFLLAVWTILRRGKGKGEKGMVFFLTAVILVSFALALGKNTPLFPWLYRHAPTFAMFQAPTRYTLWAVFALALLAGIGAQAWQRPTGRGLYWARLGAAAAAAVALGAGATALAVQALPGGISPASIRATALAGMWGVGAGALALSAPATGAGHKLQPGPEIQRGQEEHARRSRWAWAVVLFVAADLVVAGWGLNPAASQDVYRAAAPTAEIARALGGDGRLYLPPAEEQQLKFERFFRFDTFHPPEGWGALRASLVPNLNMLDGLASANNFDPLVPGRYARWMDALAAADPATERRMLNLMGVQVVEHVDESQPDGVRFAERAALPRLRWAACGRAARDGEAALGQVLKGAMDIDQEVVLEAGADSLNPDCGERAGGKEVTLQILSENPNGLAVQARAESAGYLVLSDVWYPGWQALVDGKAAPILRANYLFRAVPVPAGEHAVTLAYRPAWLYLGPALSALAWLGLGAWALRGLRAARRGQSFSLSEEPAVFR
jgi:hypothetical protein